MLDGGDIDNKFWCITGLFTIWLLLITLVRTQQQGWLTQRTAVFQRKIWNDKISRDSIFFSCVPEGTKTRFLALPVIRAALCLI